MPWPGTRDPWPVLKPWPVTKPWPWPVTNKKNSIHFNFQLTILIHYINNNSFRSTIIEVMHQKKLLLSILTWQHWSKILNFSWLFNRNFCIFLNSQWNFNGLVTVGLVTAFAILQPWPVTVTRDPWPKPWPWPRSRRNTRVVHPGTPPLSHSLD
jgi:hypothetical protein